MSTHHHHHDIDFKKAFTVTNEGNSTIKIAGEIPWEELQNERKAAIKKIGQNIKLDGFRPGHVPEAMIVKQVGEMAILSEMAERAIAHMYPHIVEAHELDVIGYPEISITKIAAENPLGFTATVAILPTFTLPDYKALAKETNKNKPTDDVTDEDVETQINDILRRKVAYDRLQAKATKQGDTTDEATLPTPESESEKAEDVIETEEDLAKLPLPELTDELVATLGQPGQFTNVDDFKSKIKEHLTIEKKRDNEAKHRANITDTIVGATTIELPQVLIDSELNQMFAQMEEDITRAGLKFDDYLTHVKKTREDLKTEWTPAAEKRAKLQLVLNEIAKKEDVEPEQNQLDAQVKQLLEQYKDADERRVRIYVASVMQNEAVMKLLESYS
ncbi:MAG: trigger factor [Candidatus Paceibacteria bacterium]